MKNFCLLLDDLVETKNTKKTTSAILDYLKNTDPANAQTGISLLLGYKPHKSTTLKQLRAWALEYTGLPEWIFEESHAISGDLLETISLFTGNPKKPEDITLEQVLQLITLHSEKSPEEEFKIKIFSLWDSSSIRTKLILNRLLTGNFRSPVKTAQIVKALADFYNLPESAIYITLKDHDCKNELLRLSAFTQGQSKTKTSAPYQFVQPTPISEIIQLLENPSDWIIHHFGTGMRVQLHIQQSGVFLWSDQYELLNNSFPDIISQAGFLPQGTVLEGELLSAAGSNGRTLLSKRLNARQVTQKLINQTPVLFSIYDGQSVNARDLLTTPLRQRLVMIKEIVEAKENKMLCMAKNLTLQNMTQLDLERGICRNAGASGLLLRKGNGIYGSGNEWLFLKNKPLSLLAVLMYAQQGTGKYSGLFSEYTWGVWRNDALVLIAKTNSGLEEKEILELDRFVKENRIEKFGPVQTVKAEVVAEIEYDRAEVSVRHKAGFVLINARLIKLRKDLRPEEADGINKLLVIQ